MSFKKNLILVLLVAFMYSTVTAVFEDYDEDILREVLRTQVQCSEFLSAYMHNCSAKLEYNLKICQLKDDILRDKLKRNSWESRRSLALFGNEACTSLQGCNEISADESITLNCVAEQASQASVTMTDMHYQAKAQQIDYNKNILEIDSSKRLCITLCAEELHNKTSEAMNEIYQCLQSGIWTKQELVPVVLDTTDESDAIVKLYASELTVNPEYNVCVEYPTNF